MPFGDGTGPFGHGPRTGRWFGSCPRSFRRGRGFGPGFGWRGRGYRFNATATTDRAAIEEEISYMEERMRWLKGLLSHL